MKELKLLKHEIFSEVVENTYFIQHGEDKIVYKEWVNNGTVIDFILRDKDGYDIDDSELMDQVMGFVDEYTNVTNDHK